VSHLSNGDGLSIGSDGNWGSSVTSITVGSDGNWGSLSNGVSLLGISDWGSFSSNSVSLLGNSDWGNLNVLSDGGDWLVNGVAGLLDDWGLNNLVDWVDLVGLGNWVGLFNLNGVWLGNVGLVDDLSLDWDWVWYWDINWVTVDIEFGLDAGHLGGDPGVGADWSGDSLLGNGISWGWAVVTWCWWDDWVSWGWDGWGGNCDGGLGSSGFTSNVRVSGLLFKGLSGNDVLVSSDDLLASDLNGAGSNNSVVNNGLRNSWSGMDCLVDSCQWGSCNCNLSSSKACIPVSNGWGSTAKSDQRKENQELCHCQLTV